MALWRAGFDPAVVICEARPETDAALANAFDITHLPCPAVVISSPAGEHLLIGGAALQIRLDVRRGTVLHGPVRLHYDLSGRVGLEAKLLTLQRLAALLRLGRIPRHLADRVCSIGRWVVALRALDGRRAGASYREIATALFGEARVASDWTSSSDYLRTRVQRLVRRADGLARGGYRQLLQ